MSTCEAVQQQHQKGTSKGDRFNFGVFGGGGLWPSGLFVKNWKELEIIGRPLANSGQRLNKSSKGVYCFLYSQTVIWRAENNFRATRETSLTMKAPVNSTWDGIERRKPNSCRRKAERRAYRERRCDTRDGNRQSRRSFYGWLRALIQARLGVDRRKNIDRRQLSTRRRPSPRSLITKEELADLLK